MSKLTVEDTSLVAVADAIRTKGGTTDTLIFPDGFVDAIGNIQSGGGGVGGIEIPTNSYKISINGTWSATSKSYVSGISINDFSLFGNMNVKVSSGYVPQIVSSGSTYYRSISFDWDKVISSIFGDMLADGTYRIWHMIGNGKYFLNNSNLTISNGTTKTIMNAQAYASTNSYKFAYIYIIGIQKTA